MDLIKEELAKTSALELKNFGNKKFAAGEY